MKQKKTKMFIIYDQLSDNIITTGRVDISADNARKDGSTMLEYIERKQKEGYKVKYYPDQEVPDYDKHRITNGNPIKHKPIH